MKHFFLMIIALVVMSSSIYAQDTSKEETRNKFQFGLKAGANYANVYDSKGEEFRADGKFGFVGGLFIAIPIGLHVGFQPELLFSQKGFKATGRLLGTTYELTRTSNFIDVPLLLAIKPIQTLSILVGPQFSFLMKNTDKFDNNTTSFEVIREFENDNIRKNLLGILAGVDVNLNHIVLGARAGWDLYENNGDGTSSTPRYKNAWVQATIGFRIL
jgi:opacity protein-like surface antigen